MRNALRSPRLRRKFVFAALQTGLQPRQWGSWEVDGRWQISRVSNMSQTVPSSTGSVSLFCNKPCFAGWTSLAAAHVSRMALRGAAWRRVPFGTHADWGLGTTTGWLRHARAAARRARRVRSATSHLAPLSDSPAPVPPRALPAATSLCPANKANDDAAERGVCGVSNSSIYKFGRRRQQGSARNASAGLTSRARHAEPVAPLQTFPSALRKVKSVLSASHLLAEA